MSDDFIDTRTREQHISDVMRVENVSRAQAEFIVGIEREEIPGDVINLDSDDLDDI